MAVDMTELYQRIHHTAMNFVMSYSQERCGADIKALSSTLSPDCRRFFAPASMWQTVPSLAKGRTNEEYEQQMIPELTQLYASWHVEIKDIVVDEPARKAVTWSVHYCTTKQGKEYPFEIMFTLNMNQTGDRIDRIVEFVDGWQAHTFMEEQTEITKHMYDQQIDR